MGYQPQERQSRRLTMTMKGPETVQDKLSSDPSVIETDAGSPRQQVRTRTWDDVVAEADASFVPADVSLMSQGPLALPGVVLPTDKLDFMWGRRTKITGDDDVANIQRMEKAGWRVAPADLVNAHLGSARTRTMDGGVAVEGMVLMYRTKRASAAVRAELDRRAEAPLANVLSEYNAEINRVGLSSQLPKSTFDNRHKIYRGRQALAELDDS